MKMEIKNKENDFGFWIFHLKIGLCINFPGNLGKNFVQYFKIFLTIRGKIKIKMKKYGQMISIFKFSIPNYGYVAILVKIPENFFDWSCKTMWAIKAKMKMKIEK